MSELRTIVIVFAFLVGLMVLIGTMPPGFQTVATQDVNIGNYDTNSLIAWNTTTFITLSSSPYGDYRFDLGGFHIQVLDDHAIGTMGILTYDFVGPFMYNQDVFTWYSNNTAINDTLNGYPAITIYTIEDIWEDTHNLAFTLKNSKTKINAYFNFSSAWINPLFAYAAGALELHFNIDFNDRNTSISGWNIISLLLIPFTGIPGVPTEINIILRLIILGASLYLIFILLLRIVGAVFGGGGA
jgi:hypothetical protein